jgi:hypothetical protein
MEDGFRRQRSGGRFGPLAVLLAQRLAFQDEGVRVEPDSQFADAKPGVRQQRVFDPAG